MIEISRSHSSDPFNLKRFTRQQSRVYPRVLSELQKGRKKTHWIWFIFPQITGLGSSEKSCFFAIRSAEEARAYLDHPVLGQRLIQCVEIISSHTDIEASKILGEIDAIKYKSCLTLFEIITGQDSVFAKGLKIHFAEERDHRTLEIIAADSMN